MPILPHIPDPDLESAERQRERIRSCLVHIRSVTDAELYALAEHIANNHDVSLVETLADVQTYYRQTREWLEELASRYGLPT